MNLYRVLSMQEKIYNKSFKMYNFLLNSSVLNMNYSNVYRIEIFVKLM